MGRDFHMNTQQRDFLKIISATLTNRSPDFQGYQLAEDWKRLHKISSEQKLSPMIYDQLYCLPAFQKALASLQQKWMGEALAAAGKQVVQAESFASVCDQLAGQGIRYAVLKGISCKVWYPKPELRPSGDEDILIDLKDAAKCDEILRSLHYDGYTGALKAPVRCFGNHLSEKRKSLFQTDNKCGGAAILKNRTSRMGTPVGC